MSDFAAIATTLAQAVQAAEAAAPVVTNHPIGAGLAMGIGAIGAGLGIGLVGFATISGMARQPEQANNLKGTMFVLAALIELPALVAAVFGLLMSLK